MVKKIIPYFIVIFFAIVAGFALLHPGMIPTHDGEYHVLRFYEFDKTLKSGVWYPRWAQDFNFGYGIPLFNYVYPLPNYFASFLHIFGFNFIDSFKINMFVASLFGAVGMYLFSKEYWGKLGGIVSSVFYTFAPYHFVDIYIRGSVGEVWALGLFPLALWSLKKMIKNQDKRFIIPSVLFLAAIILAHNILALGFFIFVVSYLLLLVMLSNNKRQIGLQVLFLLWLSIGLSAVFWLPAIFETKYVVGLQVFDLKSNFPDLYQLLVPSWGSGFFGGTMENQMSVQIGLTNVLIILLSLCMLPFLIIKKRKNVSLVIFSLVWLFVLFFLMLKVSLPIWEKVPLLYYFQFPWRLLSLVILLVSLLAGALIYYSRFKLFLVMLLIVLAIGTTWQYAKSPYYFNRDDNHYISRSNFIDSTNSPGNSFNTLWIAGKINHRSGFSEGLKIQKKQPQYYLFNSNNNKDINVILPLAYFPGWELRIDKNSKKIINTDGEIGFVLPKGKHTIELTFSDTPIRTIALLISLISLLLVLTILVKNWYSRSYEDRS
jgi:uncharacterized membrane protein